MCITAIIDHIFISFSAVHNISFFINSLEHDSIPLDVTNAGVFLAELGMIVEFKNV